MQLSCIYERIWILSVSLQNLDWFYPSMTALALAIIRQKCYESNSRKERKTVHRNLISLTFDVYWKKSQSKRWFLHSTKYKDKHNNNENHDIAIAMSSSRTYPVLGLNILQGWLGAFKRLILTTNERVGWSLHWLVPFKCLILTTNEKVGCSHKMVWLTHRHTHGHSLL